MVAARALWAVELIGVEPDHQLLEIGCGSGTAVALVCQHLRSGGILAIDRSAAAVERARQRNADNIARGLARIEQIDLTKLDVPAGCFDTVFALNVNILSTGAELPTIDRVLRPGGRLVLGHELPSRPHLDARAERVSATLRNDGWATAVTWPGANRVAIVATKPIDP